MKIMTVFSLLALTLLAACSNNPRREEANEVLSRYSAYSGEPVTQFNMYSRFDSWSAVDNDHVLIHTNVNESYLLTVAPGCFQLPFATSIALTSKFPNTVQSGFDSVRVGRETCRITEIRPVNYKQMKADLAAAKKGKG
jgi:hypothetical protein